MRIDARNILAAGIRIANNEAGKFFRTLALMVRAPGEFARLHIGGRTELRLVAAIQFFLAVFVFTFALRVFSQRFLFYEGSSEIRETAKLFVQLALGVPLVYALFALLRYKATLTGILQIALYVDAIYLLVLGLVSVPLHYFGYLANGTPSAQTVDIFATELERCIAQTSFVYWALRGDLQFYLYGDQWRDGAYLRTVIENLHFIVALPFLLLFAAIFRAKYGGRIAVILLLAAAGTFLAFFAVTRAEAWLVDNRTAAAPDCPPKALASIMRKYSTDLVAKQVEYKINNDLTKSAGGAKQLLYYRGDHFLWHGSMARSVIETQFEAGGKLPETFRRLYCSNNWYWTALRATQLPFVVRILSDGTEEVVFTQRYEARECGG